MNGFARALLTIPFGYMKLGAIKVLHSKRIYFGRLPRVAFNTEISLDKDAKMCIGERFNMRESARIRVRKSAKLQVGKNAYININCMIACHDCIEIGDDVQFGPNVQLYDHDHDFRAEGGTKAGKYKKSPIKIGSNVWIGANSIIMRGAIIGDDCVIAAGTIVRAGEYPKGTLIYNARIMKVRLIDEKESLHKKNADVENT